MSTPTPQKTPQQQLLECKASTKKSLTRKTAKKSKGPCANMPPCRADLLLVQCSHHPKERSFLLKVSPSIPGQIPAPANVLQVISETTKPEEITLMINGACGKLKKADAGKVAHSEVKNHANPRDTCPSVKITGSRVNAEDGTGLICPVYPPKLISEHTFSEFFKHFLCPVNHRANRYNVSVKGCQGASPLTAIVEVYPPISWTGNIKVGYAYKKTQEAPYQAFQPSLERKGNPLPAKRPIPETKTETVIHEGWFFEGSLEVDVDGDSWGLEYEKENTDPRLADPKTARDKMQEMKQKNAPKKRKITKTKDIPIGGFRKLEKITDFFSSLTQESKGDKTDLTGGKIEWPTISLKGEYSNAESKTTALLEPKFNFSIGFSPLIGATFTADIIPLIMKNVEHPLVIALNEIRVRIEKGAGGENFNIQACIKILLSVKGRVSGKVSWKKQGQNPLETGGEVKGSLGFSAEGKIEAKLKAKAGYFKVEIAGGGKIRLQGAEASDEYSEFTVNFLAYQDNYTPGLDGLLEYNGLAVYVVVYCEVNVSLVDNEDKKDDGIVSEKKGKKSKNKGEFEIKKAHVFVLIDAFKWPEKAKKTPINQIMGP